ncbi:MAG: hypothetical protein Q7U55_05495, partial [Deltaproteobacteria bacterium]|nr:hypothetical protein [Deltaproteobacteria bacterium]
PTKITEKNQDIFPMFFWTNGKVVEINSCESKRFSGIARQYEDTVGEEEMILGMIRLFGGQYSFQFIR